MLECWIVGKDGGSRNTSTRKYPNGRSPLGNSYGTQTLNGVEKGAGAEWSAFPRQFRAKTTLDASPFSNSVYSLNIHGESFSWSAFGCVGCPQTTSRIQRPGPMRTKGTIRKPPNSANRSAADARGKFRCTVAARHVGRVPRWSRLKIKLSTAFALVCLALKKVRMARVRSEIFLNKLRFGRRSGSREKMPDCEHRFPVLFLIN